MHVWVSGRVQGVCFRDSTSEEAEYYGVKGWVRNLPDGRVEAVFSGEKAAVGKLVDFVKQGPALARVTEVECREERPGEEFEEFLVR